MAAACLLLPDLLLPGAALAEAPLPEPPASLRETGLYADFERLEVDPDHLSFAPQYPLWTDGALKRRWLSLPPGAVIDASDPEAWRFPPGTTFWKEFAFDGRRVETRMIERLADGRWRFATYEWSPDGREATLAPPRGRLNAYDLGGGRGHAIPGRADCAVCHGSGPAPILGFTALQLSTDRDPGALHPDGPAPEADLATLAAAGVLVGLPPELLEAPPRIAAATPEERSALGYLHGNCGHCHNDDGPLRDLGLVLRHDAGLPEAPALITAVGRPSRKLAPGQPAEAVLRIAAGDPGRSGLLHRMSSREASLQMPPLGTGLADGQAIALVRRWIAGLQVSRSEGE
jgi:hypothetical protein